MPKVNLGRLSDDLEKMYKYYHGWHFFFEFPMLMSYQQMGGPITVLCTPDYNRAGFVAIEIGDDAGRSLGTEEVPYEGQIDAPELFKIVKPYLDKHSER